MDAFLKPAIDEMKTLANKVSFLAVYHTLMQYSTILIVNRGSGLSMAASINTSMYPLFSLWVIHLHLV